MSTAKKTATETNAADNSTAKKTAAETNAADNSTADNSTADNNTAEKESEITIEEAFSQIDTILEEMEDESVSLEKSFELYQKGISLVKQCNETIEKVEKQVLTLNDQGETDEF